MSGARRPPRVPSHPEERLSGAATFGTSPLAPHGSPAEAKLLSPLDLAEVKGQSEPDSSLLDCARPEAGLVSPGPASEPLSPTPGRIRKERFSCSWQTYFSSNPPSLFVWHGPPNPDHSVLSATGPRSSLPVLS